MEKYKILSLNGRKGKKGRRGGERIEGRFQGKKKEGKEKSPPPPPPPLLLKAAIKVEKGGR